MVSGFLVKAGVAVQSWEIFYKSVVQAVLVNCSESWVVTNSMMKVLEGFHHRIACSITVKMKRCIVVDGW